MKKAPLLIIIFNVLSFVACVLLLIFAIASTLITSIMLCSFFGIMNAVVTFFLCKQYSDLYDLFLKREKQSFSLLNIISYFVVASLIAISIVFHNEIFSFFKTISVSKIVDDVYQGVFVCLTIEIVVAIFLLLTKRTKKIKDIVIDFSLTISGAIISASLPYVLLLFFGQFFINVAGIYIVYYVVSGINLFFFNFFIKNFDN